MNNEQQIKQLIAQIAGINSNVQQSSNLSLIKTLVTQIIKLTLDIQKLQQDIKDENLDKFLDESEQLAPKDALKVDNVQVIFDPSPLEN